MNFYTRYEDRDDILGKNDDWKINFYNYYKLCDYSGEIFLNPTSFMLLLIMTSLRMWWKILDSADLFKKQPTTNTMNKCFIEEEHERDSIIVIYYIRQLDNIICLFI